MRADRDDLARHLLDQAVFLVRSNGKKPSYKRRAVSCAYYAVFHAFAKLCADVVMPDSQGEAGQYERVYRSLDHTALRTVFGKDPLRSDPAMRLLGAKVTDLQSARHEADYAAPRAFVFTRSTCMNHISEARKVIEMLEALPGTQCRTLAICLLFKDRKT